MSPSGWLPLKVEAVDPSSRASTPSSTVRSPERIFAVSLDRPRPSHKGVPAVTRPTPTSGNGPNYVEGPIRVLAPDPFDLDRDGNGLGCES